MKLNIVTETKQQRWVLRNVADDLARVIPGAVVSTKVNPEADVNMFVNYALYEPVNTMVTALFTHRETTGPVKDRFDTVAKEVNHCFAMNMHTLKLLPVHKSSLMWVWPSPLFYKDKLVIGVCGRDYKSGRKRMSWIDELRNIPFVEVRTTEGKLAWEDMPAYYDGLDYLVVISDNEGGPIPVVEALARGCPVIAPDVGYCWDFPVLRYTTKGQLLSIVKSLIISSTSWEETGKRVTQVHEGLLSQDEDYYIYRSI